VIAAVLPIGDVNPTHRRPVLTWLLLLVNIGVFAYQLGLDACAEQAFVYRYAAIPRELVTLSPLAPAELEQILGPCVEAVDGKPVLLSAVTAMFLHGGLLHLAGNLLFLFIFGNNVEDRLGRGRFLLFYAVGGVAATAAHVAMQPTSIIPLVGASGAIAAILGAYLIMYPRAKVFTIVPFPLYLLALVLPKVRIRTWFAIAAVVAMPAWLLLVGWFLVQFDAASTPGTDLVAYDAHVAGFVMGIVLVLVLDRGRQRRGQPTFHPVRHPSDRRPPPPPPPPPPSRRGR
jgi:membrane associated rhomboid family serine protease